MRNPDVVLCYAERRGRCPAQGDVVVREILTCLNPKSSWPDPRASIGGRGPGGQVALAQQVAAALAGDDEAADVVYALHAADQAAVRRVVASMASMAGVGVGEHAEALAALALAELAHQHQCGRCGGTGAAGAREVHAGERAGLLPGLGLPVCPSCDGSGMQRLSARGRAARIGVAWTTWRRRYAGVYERMYGWLAGAERRARDRVVQRLGLRGE